MGSPTHSEDKTEFTENAAPGITTKEFATFIKEQRGMTWEETCYFLLRLTMADLQIQEQLKKNMVETKIPKPMQLIVASTNELGWGFIVTKTENGKADNLNGLIIGHPEFLDGIMKQLYPEKI